MTISTQVGANTPAKQPAVIPIFFATEMWERFGFYMIQSLLVLYMTSTIFDFSDVKSYAILGAFSAIAYITPILGGYVASRVLDYEHAVTLGGFLLAIGYALLSLPHQSFFYVALATISIGNGFFKPNISSYLGDFYHHDDPYREKGYTIFYIGINIGVLLSTSISGYIVRYFGWHIPFMISSIGLLVGTITFVFGLYYLKNTNNFHRIKPSVAKKNPTLIALVYIGAVILTFASYFIIRNQAFGDALMLWGSIVVFFGLFLLSLRYKGAARRRLIVCIILTMISIVFWAIYMQMFFSMNLFIHRVVDRHFFSFVLPTPIFISLESIFIILLGPLFAHLWQTLSRKNKNISIPFKFAYALLLLAVAFLIAFISTKEVGPMGSSMFYIACTYLIIAAGELFLSPVGLAMVTMLAPQELVGLMMGVWFVALGLGEKLAGLIADYAAIPKHLTNVNQIATVYGNAFYHYAILALVCGLICLIFAPMLKKLAQ